MADLAWRKLRSGQLSGGALVCVLVLPGCGGDYSGQGEGPGHRNQVIALTAEQEVKLGDEAFQEVLAKEREIKGPPHERVESIAEKIFQKSEYPPLRREIGLRDADAHGRPWNFKDRRYAVLQEQEVNAFCLPGGKVAVFTGLLDMTAGHDDWLATVLGHEIAHALAHHASERIARENMYAQASDSSVSGFGLLDRVDRWRLIDLLGVGGRSLHYAQEDERPDRSEHSIGVFQQIRELSFDRQQESEADHIGIFLMAFAGYDPDQAVVFWQAMADRSKGQGIPEILSDHPSDAHRVAAMKGWAVRAKDALQAEKAGRIDPKAQR